MLYVPGIHRGYLSLLERYQGRLAAVYVLGQSLLDEFPVLQREIRAISPAAAVRLLSSLVDVPVAEVDGEGLRSLAAGDTTVVLSQEELSDRLLERYLAGATVVREPVFLRYDEQYVRQAHQEPFYDGQITSEAFARQVIGLAEQEAGRSADWFRRVGAALVVEGKVVLLACNQRMPASHDTWLVGDPRMYLEYGSATFLRTVLHAEQALIAGAARLGISTAGADLYTTVYPCPDCVSVIGAAGIARCFFKGGYAALQADITLAALGVQAVRVVEEG